MDVRPNIELLKNQIDYSKAPFSDRGSRLLVFLNTDDGRLFVRLAERLTNLEPDIEAYLQRPPFIHELHLIDQDGADGDVQVIQVHQWKAR